MRLPCLGIPKNNDIYTFYNRKFPTYEYCAILTANVTLQQNSQRFILYPNISK